MLQKNYFLNIVSIVVIWICVTTAQKPLPSYIKPCSLSAPNIDECCVESGREALLHFIKGDKEYLIPPLNPLVLPSVEMDAGEFKISATNLQVIGLANNELKRAKFDLKNNKLDFLLYFKQINLVGTYSCDGKILVFPIQGNGKMNITAVDLEANYLANFVLEEKGGDKYIKLQDDSIVKFTMTRAYFEFENLFNGNEDLADITIKTLNTEWEQVIESVRPFLSRTIAAVAGSVADSVTTLVPLKHIFIE